MWRTVPFSTRRPSAPTLSSIGGRPDRLRPPVDDPLAVDPGHAALAGEDDPVAVWSEDPADELLVGPEAVERCGVEVDDPELEGREQQALSLPRARGSAVRVAEIHAAQTEEPDLEVPDAP
jgi:hypothetical protein